MNSKAQISVGTLIMVFVAIIAALAMYTGGIAPAIGSVTNTVSYNANTTAVVNGTPQYFTDIKSISGVTVTNASNGAAIGSGNYTITNNVVYNGQEAVKIVPDTTAAYKYAWNVVGTAQPLTYDASSGGRAVTGLIAIFAVLAVGVVALWPVFGSKVLDAIS